MRINTITPMNLAYTNNTQIKHNNQNTTVSQTNPLNNTSKLPLTKDFLSFTGGYSLNLAETIKNLDKLAEKNSGVYPKNIREWAGMVLEEGNRAKQTLVDIHKEYFKTLKQCTTLDEAKEKFPEFSGVKSDKEVTFTKGSFGEAVKAGNLEYFDKNEDLSLKILKLYYGDGFSLNDLKNYTGGTDIYYTMEKLGIPRQNRTYGYILKFSDPEYNERLTAEMTYSRRLTLDKKAQAEGEPVYIPRGPLSDEHKQHISEGLKKYYAENPEKILELSEKQKEFYRNNPDKAEELTRVLKKAWNIFGADRIKTALSKFLKGKGFKDFAESELEKPLSISEKKSDAIKQFWGINEWARKSFAKNMEYAWKKVKQENETKFILKSAPTQISEFVKKRAKDPSLNFDTTYNPFTMTSSIDERSNAMMKLHTNIPGLENVMADTYQIAVFEVVSALQDMKMSKKDKPLKDLLYLASAVIKSNAAGKNGYKVQTTNEAQRDFLMLASRAVESRSPEAVTVVNKALDDAFELALAAHPNVILK